LRRGRVLLAGRPHLRIVCRIAAIDEDLAADPAMADKFWHDARARLGRLHRLSPRDRDQIEALIAEGAEAVAGPSGGRVGAQWALGCGER
jgi:hypothetical protein